MSSSPATCPRCGAAASGNFCASCGAGLVSTPCAGCGASLTPGAAFCHRCGRAAGTTGAATTAPAAAAAPSNPAAWVIAALLTVIAIAAVVYAMRGRGAPPAAEMANAGNAGPAGAAPDISNLSNKERFARLNDRIMQAAEKNDTTTLFTFWPMAQGAYQNLSDAERDVDARYHMATLYLLVTQYAEVNALADTILRAAPNNLMGLYLRGMSAEYQGDSTGARAARAEFVKHYRAEIDRQQPEYLDHRPVLDAYFRAGGGQ